MRGSRDMVIINAHRHSSLREDLAVVVGAKYIKTGYKYVSKISKDQSREITR
jgi:hypothetical protein